MHKHHNFNTQYANSVFSIFRISFIALFALAMLLFSHSKVEAGNNTSLPVMTSLAPDTAIHLDVRPTQYLFRMNLASEENGHYTASTEITVRNMMDIPTTSFDLDVASELINVLSVTSMTSWTAYQFNQIDNTLEIDLPLQEGEEESIRIAYELTPGTINGPFGSMGLWYNGSNAWTFSFPDGAHAWSPIIDDPAIKVPVTWELGVEAGYHSVANGYLDSTWTDGYDVRWSRWIEENPVCTSEMGMCVDSYIVLEAQVDPFPIRYYVYPEDASAATVDFINVPGAIALYEEIFGYEYPFSELKIVECGVFGGNGGQEHQTMVSLGFNMITGNRQFEDIIVHEVAHMWFADMLTPLNWDHFWLSEGFAVYAEALFHEELEGWEGYLDNIRSDRNAYLSFLNSGGNQALVNSDYYETMNSALPYQRGSLALHQLRCRYGLDTFTNAISRYCSENAYGHVVSETLRDCFIAETGDSTLYQWFDEWVFRGEIPFFKYAISEDGERAYVMQDLSNANSPDHGLLYESFELCYGYKDEHNVVRSSWPSGETWTIINGLSELNPVPGETPQLFPNYEVPMRATFLDDVHAPYLSLRFTVTDESVDQDRVVQMNETVELQFLLSNSGLPMVNPTWTVSNDDYNLIWSETTGQLETIGFGQEETNVLSVNIRGRGIFSEHYSEFDITIADENYDTTFTMKIAMGHPEILLVSDGIENSDELETVYGPNFEELGYVWGLAGVSLDQLPEEMFGAEAVFVEADGRTAQHLFTDNDTVIRRWFTQGGSGCISGIYLHERYETADPEWTDGLFGEYYFEVQENVFLSAFEDIIFDDRFVTTLNTDGNSISTACCGQLPICYTPSGESGGGKFEDGGRIVDYGFAFSLVDNSGQATMTRDELLKRTTLWIMGEDPSSVDELGNDLIPEDFSLSTYPNPFNSELNIRITLPERSNLNLSIYNILGQEVGVIVNSTKPTGNHIYNWDAKALTSGVYFIRATNSSETITQKVVLMK